ncbi:MAG: sugar kinase [Rhodobacteraceae bacterium]|nr:sugar kinase [Paracoccaceae bacterium]
MSSILCVGATVIDFVFHLDKLPSRAEKYGTETASIVGGGCAANAAVAISRLGGSAALGAQLGDDRIGDLILSDLGAEGVDISNVTRTKGARSSFSSIYVDTTGERQIVNYRGEGLVLETGWFGELPDIGAVATDTRRVDAAIAALDVARARGVPGIVDGEAPVDPAILAPASHVAFSMQGLTTLAPDTDPADPADALTGIARTHDCWACVTDGGNGVWFTGANGVEHVAAFAIEPRDTLAAGDVWHGAFALALTEGKTEAAAIRFANAAAALKCMTFGGRQGCPSRAAVARYLEENTA